MGDGNGKNRGVIEKKRVWVVITVWEGKAAAGKVGEWKRIGMDGRTCNGRRSIGRNKSCDDKHYRFLSQFLPRRQSSCSEIVPDMYRDSVC